MNKIQRKSSLLLIFLTLPAFFVFSEASPEHFHNPQEYINPDPGFIPGAFPAPDIHVARTTFEIKKSELIREEFLTDGRHVFSAGAGEINFSIVKNESVPVLGYFRNFTAVGTIGEGGPERFDLAVDLNSLDSGVPGRDYRIQSLFFESVKPEWGTAVITFDRINLGGLSGADLEGGKTHQILAQGTLTLNGISQLVSASLNVSKMGGAWLVETISPVQILISDYGFGGRVAELMKACNHQSIGNAVEVTVKLYLR